MPKKKAVQKQGARSTKKKGALNSLATDTQHSTLNTQHATLNTRHSTQVIGAIREAAQTRHCVSLTVERGGDTRVVVVTLPLTRPGVGQGLGFFV